MTVHGTTTSYRNGCRCWRCTDANTIAVRDWRSQPHDPATLRHGEAATYDNYGCRCAPCTGAHRAYDAART